jgi:hypothetical protein
LDRLGVGSPIVGVEGDAMWYRVFDGSREADKSDKWSGGRGDGAQG